MVAAVNIAIPKLQASSLSPSGSATAWIVDSYTLVFACLLIPAGGRRRVASQPTPARCCRRGCVFGHGIVRDPVCAQAQIHHAGWQSHRADVQ
jgi:hypothetical protein